MPTNLTDRLILLADRIQDAIASLSNISGSNLSEANKIFGKLVEAYEQAGIGIIDTIKSPSGLKMERLFPMAESIALRKNPAYAQHLFKKARIPLENLFGLLMLAARNEAGIEHIDDELLLHDLCNINENFRAVEQLLRELAEELADAYSVQNTRSKTVEADAPEMRQSVHEPPEQSAIVLDTESKERALVGEVISTVALAGQISREFTVSDWGIDMEIEFKKDSDEASGKKLYLQLKSGDSHLHQRKSDGAEIFNIKDNRHVGYWIDQAFPVFLVIRNSEGEIRWMEIREYLKRECDGGKKTVKQIVFKGKRFDVMAVRRWRERVLAGESNLDP